MEPVCKMCLLEGITPIQLDKTLQDYLDSLPPEWKADSDAIQDRLSQCVRCEHHANGLCRLCGCFVQARAAKKQSRCPAIAPKW